MKNAGAKGKQNERRLACARGLNVGNPCPSSQDRLPGHPSAIS
jgi:hypothetical protein